MGYAFARFQEDPSDLLVEYAVLQVLFLFVLIETGITSDPAPIIGAPIVLILVQYFWALSASINPGYVLDLAERAASPQTLPSRRVPRLWFFRAHLRALMRVGGWTAPARFDELVLMALPDPDWHSEVRPTLNQLVTAIELGLLEKTATLSSEEAHKPYAQYLAASRQYLARNPVTVHDLRQLLVNRYSELPMRVKLLALELEKPSLIDRLSARVELWKLVLLVLAIILAVGLRVTIPWP